MTASNKEAFSEYQTLSRLLEFLARLDESQTLRQKVIEEIEKKVVGYVKDDGQKFGNNGYLSSTISNSKKLRSDILKSEETYQHYTSPFNEHDDDANNYSQLLINNIFSLFGCLYYMYYECNIRCLVIKGADWYSERCDGTGSKGQNLKEWLTDQKGDHKHVIKRGFSDIPLSQKTGKDLFPSGSSSNALLHYAQGAQLQFALYFMLFLPTEDALNSAQSGHAVLFLQAFCKKVKENAFEDMYVDKNGGTFKTACRSVAENINKLLQLQFIVPVAVTSDVSYENLLEATHFSKYVKWLQQNLENLIKSLKEMSNDVKNWDKESSKTSSTLGPYPWGFTFVFNWESKNKEQLKEPLQNLCSALSGLKNALTSISKAPSRSKKAAEKSSNSTAPTDSTNSTASTIGGVAGGLGAVGAAAAGGAAYSGVLGPVAESIGRFFKGLFI